MSQKVPIPYIVSIISSAAFIATSIGFAINFFIEDVLEESRANAVVLTITENEMVEWCESKVLKTFKNPYSDMTTVRDNSTDGDVFIVTVEESFDKTDGTGFRCVVRSEKQVNYDPSRVSVKNIQIEDDEQ